MKKMHMFLGLVVAFSITANENIFAEDQIQPAPNGLEIPEGYQDWRVLSVSHREDNKTLRVILGNDTAIRAAREKNTNPWPEGSILAKLVWKDSTHPNWKMATIPDAFVHAEFMTKNSGKFKTTGGWGFSRWKGLELKPYGDNASFVFECFGCHTPVKDQDYVFTQPSLLP